MRPVLAVLVLLGMGSFGLIHAQAADSTFELSGIGFALEKDTTGQLSTERPQPLFLKVLVRSQIGGKFPEGSSIRLQYDTYPVEVLELADNYLEADVYTAVVTETNELTRGEPLGKLKITLALFAGLEGGKGSLSIGARTYQVVFYLNQALEGYARWTKE